MHRSALVESGWRQQGISPLVKSVGRSMEARLEKAATWCAPLLCCRGATDDQPPEEPEMEAAASLARIRSQQSQGRLSSSESARENRDSGDALFATPGSGPPDRLASLEGRRPMPTTHQENVHANPNAALQWVAVMNAYYEVRFVVRVPFDRWDAATRRNVCFFSHWRCSCSFAARLNAALNKCFCVFM